MIPAFQEKTLPTDSRLAGWANLVRSFGVSVPLGRPSVVSSNHVKGRRRGAGAWNVFATRYWPWADFLGHLGFPRRPTQLPSPLPQPVSLPLPPPPLPTPS